jgi:hypothetical protein
MSESSHDVAPGLAAVPHFAAAMEVEACCLAHRKRVKWMPSPAWWYHAHGWPRSGECVPMLDENAPVIWPAETGKVFWPPRADLRWWVSTIRKESFTIKQEANEQ